MAGTLVRDMTEGSPMRRVVEFFFPLLFGLLFQQVYNMVDTIVVGKFLGVKALAGVGSTGSLSFLVLGFCIGVCNGFAIPVAQKFGERDYPGLKRFVVNAILLAVTFSLVMTAAVCTLCRPLLGWMNTPADIVDNAFAYIFVIFLGIPVVFVYNVLFSIIRSLGDSRTPVIYLVICSLLNVALDLLFILAFGMGVEGAAWATVISQAVSSLLCVRYIRHCDMLIFTRQDWRFDRACVQRLIGMGVPTGLQYSITAIGSMVMQSANNGLGSIYVSGFTAGMRIKQFAMCPFDALANGVSVFCSQNLGAGKIKRIRKGLWQGVGVGFIYGLLIGLVLIFAGRSLSMLFISADQTAVLDASAKYLRCLGFFYWSLGPLSVFRMSAQGMGFSGRAIFSGVTEMIARTFVSFAFVGTYGFTAICFADQTAWVSATLYITPVCLMCLRQVTREHERQQAKIAD